MGGSTAASDRSSAAVEEPQFHTAFLRCSMQFPVRFVKFPRTGQHSPIFVGIGIAEHDLLPMSPGTKEWLILRMPPQTAHDVPGSAQRID